MGRVPLEAVPLSDFVIPWLWSLGESVNPGGVQLEARARR